MADRAASVAWAHRRFEGLIPGDLGCALILATFACPAPGGFEAIWHTYTLDEASEEPPFSDEQCEGVELLLLLADPTSEPQLRRLHLVAEGLEELDEAPALLWAPHSVAAELRQGPLYTLDPEVVEGVLELGVEGIVSDEPEGLELALTLRALLHSYSHRSEKVNSQVKERQGRAEFHEHLKACIDDLLWSFLRSRVAPSIPAVDPSLRSGVPPSIDGCTLRQVLAKGAFGAVYSIAKQGVLLGEVIKSHDKSRFKTLEDLRMMNRTIDVMRLVSSEKHRHPNIVRLCYVYHSVTHVFFRLEQTGAENLFKQLSVRDQRGPEAFSTSWHFSVVTQAVEAVAHLHIAASVCHRDVKPESFIVQGADKEPLLKLADFDLALVQNREYGKCRTQVGTFPFVAPEVVLEHEYSGFAADIWALGIVLFEVHTKARTIEKLLDLVDGYQGGCRPSNALMDKVRTTFSQSQASIFLEGRVRDECVEFVEVTAPLFDGLLEVDPGFRFAAEAVQAQTRKLRMSP